MPTVKKQALEMMKKLLEKSTWHDIMYEIYVRKTIEAGIQAADEGKVVPHDTVKKCFLKKGPASSGLSPPFLISRIPKTTLPETPLSMLMPSLSVSSSRLIGLPHSLKVADLFLKPPIQRFVNSLPKAIERSIG